VLSMSKQEFSLRRDLTANPINARPNYIGRAYIRAFAFWLHFCATGMRDRCRGGGFSFFGIGAALGLKNGGRWRGVTPQLSGDETRQAVEQHGEDGLIWGGDRQVDLDLGFQFDDAGGEFDQAQPQSVELHDPPHRVFGHDAAHRP
jgi:hypothetical protein